MNPPPAHPVWKPSDTEALQAIAELFPREVGESAVLDFILHSEGIA